MPFRAFGFLGIYGVLLLAAFVFPAAGVWGFVFESNYHPPYNRWWGQHLAGIGDRWSYYIGAVMGLATLLHWGRLANVKLFSHPQTILLLLFTVNTCLVTAWAYDVDESWDEMVAGLKWVLVYICIIKTHSNQKWMPVVLLIYIFACIDWGWDNTFNPLGGRRVRGGCVTLGDENFVSAHIVALLPLVGCYIASSGTKWWLRGVLLLGAPFMLNIVAHAQSRGAFLALLCAGLAVLFLSKGRLRTWTIAGLVMGALVGVRLFHEQFWGRMATIETYNEDGSAEGRLVAWTNAWELSLKNPFGYGGEAFDHGLRSSSKTTHNMYFECLVAWGFQGTFLWLGYLGVSLWDCWRLRKKLYRAGEWPQSREYLEAVGLCAGMIGMLTAAIFLNRMRWELWWVFGAYIVCLKNSAAVMLSTQPESFAAMAHAPEPMHWPPQRLTLREPIGVEADY